MVLHDPNFAKVKLQGRQGDWKCDGWITGAGTVFQCYSPESPAVGKTIAKVKEDFEGALSNWPGKMKAWIFVYSEKDELPAPVIDLIETFKSDYPDLTIEFWNREKLWRIVQGLTSEARNSLLGLTTATRRVWHAPERAETFVGRKEAVETVLGLWREKRIVAVTGSGGLGKTAFCAEVIRCLEAGFTPEEHRSKRLFYHNYRNEPAHLAAMRRLVAQAGIKSDENELPATAKGVLAGAGTYIYLEACEMAEDLAAMIDLAPEAFILLTSQDEIIHQTVSAFVSPLERLSQIESEELIILHATRHATAFDFKRSTPGLSELADFLGGHALACVQAGVNLCPQGQPAKLLRDLKSEGLGKLEGQQSEHKHIAVLLGKTWDRAAEEAIGAEKVWATLALGALSPLPIELLSDATRLKPRQMDKALAALQRRGVVRQQAMPPEREGEPASGWVLGHALMSRWAELPFKISASTGADSSESFEHKLAACAGDCYPRWRDVWVAFLEMAKQQGQFPGGRSRYESLNPQFSALLARLIVHAQDDFKLVERTRQILIKERLQPGSVGSHVVDTLARDFASKPCNDLSALIQIRHNIGEQHLRLGSLTLAEQLFRENLADCKKMTLLSPSLQGPELMAANSLAITLRAIGDVKGAETLHRQTLERRTRILGAAHPDTLQSLGNLGNTLLAKGDINAAEALLKQALQELEASPNPDAPTTHIVKGNLAGLLQQKGELDQAELLLQQALQGMKRCRGEEHQETLILKMNFASLLQRAGETQKAELIYREAHKSMELVFGPNHRDTLLCLSNLAMLLKDQGDFTKAEQMLLPVLTALENMLGPDHPSILTVVNNLGALRHAEGRLDDARTLYSRAVAWAEENLEPQHPHRVQWESNLASVEQEVACNKGAKPLE